MKTKSPDDSLRWKIVKEYWRAINKPELIAFIDAIAHKRINQSNELDSKEP